MKNVLILLAGGLGNRFSQIIPKQFIKIGNDNPIEYFLKHVNPAFFDKIQIIVNVKFQKQYLSNLKNDFKNHNIAFVNSGISRQESSKKGILSLLKNNPKNVLIHDSARPYVTNKLIRRLIKSLDKEYAVAPFINHNDLVKYKDKLLNSAQLMHIQTPQAFRFKTILKAHKLNKLSNAKDDCSLIEDMNIKVKYLKGEKTNIKITYEEDKLIFQKYKNKEFRHGIGYDVHRIDSESKKKLILCGVTINHLPLIAHSDGDVGYHAICDSILGSLSMKDIGFHFKNTDKKWKNKDSKFFIKYCMDKLIQNNFKIVNIDINFICETPNINKISNKMKKNICKLLDINSNQISIKATTNEKIGFIGNGEGIAAESIVQIVNE